MKNKFNTNLSQPRDGKLFDFADYNDILDCGWNIMYNDVIYYTYGDKIYHVTSWDKDIWEEHQSFENYWIYLFEPIKLDI
jgi:hypothetical protein